MKDNHSSPAIQRIQAHTSLLTPKGRILGEFIVSYPRKAVFMTTKELALACQVSEATVVRFVGQIGYNGYGEFLQALRDHVDTEMTLIDRAEISEMKGLRGDRLTRVVFEEMDNLKSFYETADLDALNRVVDHLQNPSPAFVVGSRLSYTFAYYLGWSLTKVRKDVHILKGSDSTTVDALTIAPSDGLVVIIACSRYPNELIRLGRLVRRLGLTLLLIADSTLCPLTQFAHLSLIAPSKHIPFIGNPTTIMCIINYLVIELASRQGDRLAGHQGKLEQVYRENDIFFSLGKEILDSNERK